MSIHFLSLNFRINCFVLFYQKKSKTELVHIILKNMFEWILSAEIQLEERWGKRGLWIRCCCWWWWWSGMGIGGEVIDDDDANADEEELILMVIRMNRGSKVEAFFCFSYRHLSLPALIDPFIMSSFYCYSSSGNIYFWYWSTLKEKTQYPLQFQKNLG